MKQGELGALAGIRQSTISAWVNGKCQITWASAEKIAPILGIDSARIMAMHPHELREAISGAEVKQ